MARGKFLGITIKIDFRPPAFDRGERVTYHGKSGRVTHFDGDKEGKYDSDEMGALPVLVNLRDGTTREVHLCGVVCVDFWDETAPGDWVPLASGEEVQRVNWMCDICESVVEYKMVKYLVDTHDVDPDNPVDGGPEAEYLVCSSCRKKERGRFKTREEIGL